MGFKLPGKSIQTGTSEHSSALKMVTEQKAASALKAKTYAEAYNKNLEYKNNDPDDNTKVDKRGREYGSEAEFTKAAKAWNMKTYGTHNPTADAKKAGMTKKELAAKHKASKTTTTATTTPSTTTTTTTTDPVKEEKQPRVVKTKESYADKSTTKTVHRKDGSVKKRVMKGMEKYEGSTDEDGTRTDKIKNTYRKDGSKKKEVSKYKDTGYYDKARGKSKEKYDKEGNVKRSKEVNVRDGRRTVIKTDKEGNVTTKSRRTLKGILTGKGKKKKEE